LVMDRQMAVMKDAR